MTHVETCIHQYKHNGQMLIHRSTSECYKPTEDHKNIWHWTTLNTDGHQMTSQVAHAVEMDGTDGPSVDVAWTHTDGMAHRCFVDDR